MAEKTSGMLFALGFGGNVCHRFYPFHKNVKVRKTGSITFCKMMASDPLFMPSGSVFFDDTIIIFLTACLTPNLPKSEGSQFGVVYSCFDYDANYTRLNFDNPFL